MTLKVDHTPEIVRPYRRILAVVAAIAALFVFGLAIFIAINGRFDITIAGRHRAIRRVTPVSLLAWLLAFGTAAAVGRAARDRLLERVQRGLDRQGAAIAAILAVAVAAIGVAFGAFTAAGADPYGYVSQSLLWAHGTPIQSLPLLARDAPVEPWAFCPLGYRPGVAAGTMVPTYAPGLPLQMAALVTLAGQSGAYLVVPLMAGVVVWSTYKLARRLTSAGPALLTAACVFCSPVFLFQMMQPMSDVPVTGWWLLAIALGTIGSKPSAIGAGLAASAAIVTRPNIVPVVVPVAAFVALANENARRATRVLLFAGACVPGILVVAALNRLFYGSALASGYGSLGSIYQGGEAAANAWQYVVWLWQTHSIYVFIPCVLPVLALRGNARPGAALRFCWCALAFMAVLLACYVLYLRFDHWTYLRFLLPGIPLLMIAAAVILADLLTGVGRTARVAVFSLIAALVPFAYVHTASKGDSFALKAGFRHVFEDAAIFAATTLPPNAVFISVVESGSLRHYARRLTLRFDLIRRDQADPLIAYLKSRGLLPYAALERGEVAEFRQRFDGTAMGRSAADAGALRLPPDGAVVFFPLDAGP